MISMYRVLSDIGILTIWLTPFILSYSLIEGIKRSLKDERYGKYVVYSGISLLLILAPSIYHVLVN